MPGLTNISPSQGLRILTLSAAEKSACSRRLVSGERVGRVAKTRGLKTGLSRVVLQLQMDGWCNSCCVCGREVWESEMSYCALCRIDGKQRLSTGFCRS
jgi:hypothetical protein